MRFTSKAIRVTSWGGLVYWIRARVRTAATSSKYSPQRLEASQGIILMITSLERQEYFLSLWGLRITNHWKYFIVVMTHHHKVVLSAQHMGNWKMAWSKFKQKMCWVISWFICLGPIHQSIQVIESSKGCPWTIQCSQISRRQLRKKVWEAGDGSNK